MLYVPPLPPWEGLHPLIIHFPIALLLVAPLFVLIAALAPPSRGRPYLISGLILLVLGTGALFLAASTGEAAGELAERTAAVNTMLDEHQHLATEARIVFSILSAALVIIAVLPLLLPRARGRLHATAVPIVFLGFYSLGLMVLVHTAHLGGRLVHELGVHSLLPADTSPAPPPPAKE